MPMLSLRDDSQQHQFSPYGYVPTLGICILFVVLFSLTTLAHFLQAIYTRHWFILPTIVLAGLLEILGWSARLWSSENVQDHTPFSIQIAVLIVAPTPLLGGIFIVFGRIVSILGTQYSRLSPMLYAKIFLSFDIISLVIQAVGGSWASSAANDPKHNVRPGTDLVLAGIGFQLGIIVTFGILVTEFLYRYMHEKPVRVSESGTRGVLDVRRKLGLAAVAFSTSCLFARAIYRMVELGTGWGGPVMDTQWLFGFLEAGMVVLAFYTWNLLHPGWILGNPVEHMAVDQEMSSSYSGSGEPLTYPLRETGRL